MGSSEYSNEFLLKLYQEMLKIRIAEESFVEPILAGEIRCPVHLYSGEEAIAVGVSANLNVDDTAFGTHRSHGHFLAKGGSVEELVAEVYCRETGCSKGRGGSMHLIDTEAGFLGAAPIVGGTISLALGAALKSYVKSTNQVCVSYFGDGATGEGVLFEALNFAALYKLPMLFVCENNLYSTHMPIREIRAKESVSSIAEPFDIHSQTVDGNDVLAVYEASKLAVERCRRGEGPAFLEFMTYRLRGHVGPDDNIQGTHTDIRAADEVEQWKKKDPLLRFEAYLSEQNIKEELMQIQNKIKAEVEQAHVAAKAAPRPDQGELARYVFR